MSEDAPELPAWVLAFFAGRPPVELDAWWEAVRRLYGPSGVRMDFRAVSEAPADPAAPARLAAG